MLDAGSEAVLARNVPLDSYLNYVEQCDQLPIRMRLEAGQLLAIEIPNDPHSKAELFGLSTQIPNP